MKKEKINKTDTCYYTWLTELLDSNECQRRALLIGVNDYNYDDYIGNLRYCVNDVVELNDVLSDKQRGNFSSSQLLHSENDDVRSLPTRSNIMSWTNLLANNSRDNDTILFYFAGHGFEKNGMNYLLPSDSRFNILSETAIQLEWIKETLRKSPARKKFVIIDACHSGATIGRSNCLAMSESFHDRMFSEAEGFAILSSCKIGQLSYDYPEKNHGVFSYYLLEGLRGSADTDEDGIITVPDSNSYISKKLSEWSFEKEVQQNSTFEYKVSGDFIFVRNPLEDSKESETKIKPPTQIKSQDKITKLIRDLSFMSYDEIKEQPYIFDEIKQSLFLGDIVENSKKFLKKLTTTRFSTQLPTYYMMPIVGDVTNLSAIKKWLVEESEIKQFLIIEFLGSGNFDYAGTTAKIIQNLLPSLTDSELKQVIDGIDKNGQIISSFKARSYVLAIIDAARNLISRKRYEELREILNS